MQLEITPREKVLLARALCNHAALLQRGMATGLTMQDRETARIMLEGVTMLQNKVDEIYEAA